MKIISIPAVPPSPNELRRKYRHPQAYRRLRKQWEHDLFYGVPLRHRNELIAQAAANQRMYVEVLIKHPRLYDPDNLTACLKPVLDAMKNLGYIVNDSGNKIKLAAPIQIMHPERKTIIKIGPEQYPDATAQQKTTDQI